MMTEFPGTSIVRGRVEGEALVADATLSFWGEVEPVSGRVIAVGHPLEGQSIAGRILIIRSTKGSSATPMVLRLCSLQGTAPLALVNQEIDSLAALGCIVNRIPLMVVKDPAIFHTIRSGDWVVVDSDQAKVTLKRTGAR